MMFLSAFKVPPVLWTVMKNGLLFPAIGCHLPVFFPFQFHRSYPYNLGCFHFSISSKITAPEDYQKPPATKDAKPIKKEGRTHNRTFPFSVFSAGAAKRRSEFKRKGPEETEDSLEHGSKRGTIEVPSKPLCAEEWKILKEKWNKSRPFEDQVMNQLISSGDINVARSLLVFAARENSIGYLLLLKYLVLCVNQNQTSEIYDLYEIMKARFKTFEASAYSLFIKGFSQTDRWEESLSLLETMKKTITPSRKNYGDCIRGALGKKKGKIAWDLYYEMLESNLAPSLDVLKALFDAGKAMKDDGMFKSELVEVLLYMRNKQVYPDENLMQSIKSWFESIPGEDWKGCVSTVENSGRCRTCSHSLESINLSQEEYGSLKDVILNDVIQGSDTFRKTTPEELQEFQKFVASHPPYDIVIDGLNVGSSLGKGCRSQILLDVVSFLAQQNLRLLVLGRKHMLKPSNLWRKQDMALIKKKANCFFTENISEDDPFLLYATLNSGSHCRFITRDLLRDHKACLPDAQTQRLFFKWQRGHQMVLPCYNPRKPITFQPVLSYDTIVQTTGDTWHIPYDMDNLERASYEVPRNWLCLQRQDHNV